MQLGKRIEDPDWWRRREQKPSPIEQQFLDAVDELADKIEDEVWFADSEHKCRYRVDFLMQDARLIIELDGHDYHSSKKQLKKDAERQRYLTRAGYSVIRYTGSEIYNNVEKCLAELRDIYLERRQRAPVKYRTMFVDLGFLIEQISLAMKFQAEYAPDSSLVRPSLEECILHGIEWLHERSFVTIYVFYTSEESEAGIALDGITRQYRGGDVRINSFKTELVSSTLGEKVLNYGGMFDDFYVLADDPAYIPPLTELFKRANGKLLRKGNEDTFVRGTELAYVRWQRAYYPICSAMGLESHQM